MSKFYNVTVHISVPANSAQEAETRVEALINDAITSHPDRDYADSINADVYNGDTTLCSGHPDDDEDEYDDDEELLLDQTLSS